MPHQRIAIVGAGFAGLAVCWHVLEQTQASITLFDAQGIGKMASGASAGLLHPFTGQLATKQGREGLIATRHLLDISSKALGKPVARQSGLLRVPVTDRQQQHFFASSQQYPDQLSWLTPEETQQRIPELVSAPGLLIKEGMVVNPTLYLEGLWKACEERGAKLKLETIQNTNALLDDFDVVVLATGALSVHLSSLKELPIRLLKGQIIELAWPNTLPPLPLPISGEVYLIPNPNNSSLLVGATFERTFADALPDPDFAERYLRPKAEALLPPLKEMPLLACRAGIRATTPSHNPIAKRIGSRLWVLTGLGSKGLLYHAHLAQLLVKELSANIIK